MKHKSSDFLETLRNFHVAVPLQSIKDFIENQGDITATDEDGWTCLHLLCNNRKCTLELLEYLIERGANPKALTVPRQYPCSINIDIPRDCLYYYCVQRPSCPFRFFVAEVDISMEILKYLIQRGANPASLKCISQRIFRENDLQLSLVLLSLNEFPRSFPNKYHRNAIDWDDRYQTSVNLTDTSSLLEGTSLCKFAAQLQNMDDRQHILWRSFQEELFGMLSTEEQVNFLVTQCQYFPKFVQQQMMTMLLSIKYSSLLFTQCHLKIPKPLQKILLAETLGIKVLPLLILIMSDEVINQALENTLQKCVRKPLLLN